MEYLKNTKEQLQSMRHSLSHLLAAAVLELWPDSKSAIGPAIEDGFYYDFEFRKPILEEDMPKIETKMREIMKTWDEFERQEVTQAHAKKYFAANPYKLELIDEFSKKGQKITLYKSGDFIDLCRGGHIDSMKKIDPKSFTITKLAGAYWRGDEKNIMLTRIYGAAFAKKSELRKYLEMIEEAKRRDHRKLGQELDLFTFSELVGAGLPLLTPHGTTIKNEIEKYLEQLQLPRGYQKVTIPHLAKKELYITSGHWEKFSDDIFHVASKHGEGFVLKPMNCPHHTQIYASRHRSYRELPIRYFEVTEVYRDEKPGQLLGLSRVRSITQDDAHCFCRPDQVEEETNSIYGIIEEFYKTFHMSLTPRLSLRDKNNSDKYIGHPRVWDFAEEQLRGILKKRVKNFEEIPGEAAFYGPKIDFDAQDALGRKWQLATIQLDFAMPERFKLEYADQKGKKARPVMIHRAISGSFERFLSILIENYAGAFPLWLSPVQVHVVPVGQDFLQAAKGVTGELEKHGIRVWLDGMNETVGYKVRKGEKQKIPYILVVGQKEAESQNLNVRVRGQKKITEIVRHDFIKQVLREIQERS